MDIKKYMEEGSLTAEMAHDLLIESAKVIEAGNEIPVSGFGGTEQVVKPRIRISAVGLQSGITSEVKCWLILRPQDCILLGTKWGENTEKWVGKNLLIHTKQHGNNYRMKVWPGSKLPK